MSVVTVFSLFAMPYSTLMPAFAKAVFKTNAAGMGNLFSAVGLGALIGALFLARKSDEAKPSVVTASSTGLGVALVAFALSRNLYLAIAALPFVGFFATSQNATANTLVQTMVPDRLRGRVMSAYMMIFQGVMPFGNLQAGFVAELWGAPVAVEIGGAVLLAYGGLVAWYLSRPARSALAASEEG
jgi:MFS-type transporter involved in bile tolerance (Atg22 family)